MIPTKPEPAKQVQSSNLLDLLGDLDMGTTNTSTPQIANNGEISMFPLRVNTANFLLICRPGRTRKSWVILLSTNYAYARPEGNKYYFWTKRNFVRLCYRTSFKEVWWTNFRLLTKIVGCKFCRKLFVFRSRLVVSHENIAQNNLFELVHIWEENFWCCWHLFSVSISRCNHALFLLDTHACTNGYSNAATRGWSNRDVIKGWLSATSR